MSDLERARRRVAQLEAKQAARERTRAAAARYAQARADLDDAIRSASAHGVPDTENAADAGFTRQWIAKLLRRR
jgi:hypothetical protein